MRCSPGRARKDIVSLLLLLSSLPHYKEVRRTLIVRQIVLNRVKVTRTLPVFKLIIKITSVSA